MDLFEAADRYPNYPGHKARETSEDAAKAIAPASQILRAQVLALMDDGGWTMTADEAAEALGKDRLSIRPRFSELARMGKIKDTGLRRSNDSGRNAVVWCVT